MNAVIRPRASLPAHALWLAIAFTTGCEGAITGSGSTDASGAADSARPANQPPVASFESNPGAGPQALTVTFDASASTDPDGTIEAFAWDFGDGGSGQGAQSEHTFASAGCYSVVLTVEDDDGAAAEAEATIVVTAGAPDGATPPTVTFSQLPVAMQLVPRDLDTNQGTVPIAGTVSSIGYDAVVVKVLRDGSESRVERTPLCSLAADDPFELMIDIPAELASYGFQVYVAEGTNETLVAEVEDVVAGDVILIQGQSNAVAALISGSANLNQGRFVRSFGSSTADPAASAADNQWRIAEGDVTMGPASIGQWGIRMGRLLVDTTGIPVAILNGGHGGQQIGFFQRDDLNPLNTATNYGRFLRRAQDAGIAGDVRAILFYQGESDGGNATGHHDGFVALYQDWLDDFDGVERVYVTQVRVGCGMPSMELRDVQRRLGDDYENISVMSTTGLDGHDGCHFFYENGYHDLGQRYASMLTRDLYGGTDTPSIDPPNPERAYFSATDGTEVTLVMRRSDSILHWDDGAEANFVMEGSAVTVAAGRAEAGTLVLTLSGDGRGATGLSYAGHSGAGPWVTNSGDVGLLAFYALPIDPS